MNIVQLLRSFASGNDFRPTLRHPFIQQGFVYASDGHIILKVPADQVTEIFQEQELPDISILNYTPLKKQRTIRTVVIKELLDKIEKVNQQQECEACEGNGKHECDKCDDLHECGICAGKGYTEDERVKIYPKEGVYIKIGAAWFSPYYINYLLRVANSYNSKQIVLEAGGSWKPNWFKVGGATVAIMGIDKTHHLFDEAIKHILLK